MRKTSSMKLVAIYFICLGLICIIAVLLYGCKSASQVKSTDKYLQQSRIDPRRTVIYGADGQQEGYLQQSPIDRRVTVEYDKKGNVKGYWKQDPVDSRKTRYYKKK